MQLFGFCNYFSEDPGQMMDIYYIQTPGVCLSVAVTDVQVSKENMEISLGDSEAISVTVLPSNATDKTVSYSVKDPAIVKVVTIDGIDMVEGLSEGETTITVSSKNGKTATIKVKVVNVIIEKLEFPSQSADVGLNGTTTVLPKYTPENASKKELKWESSNPAVAEVDQNGKVTGRSTGVATITATATDGSNVSAQYTIKVSEREDMTVELVHAYEQENGEEIPNTVLYGQDMMIRVRVKGDNDQGVPNENVTLRMYRDKSYLERNGGYDSEEPEGRYEIKKDYAVTDAEGYATFIVGLKGKYASKNMTDGVAETYNLTATRLNSNANATHKDLTVHTATINLDGIQVETDSKKAKLEYSDNADGLFSGNAVYTNKPDPKKTARNSQYVVSQKVSPKNETTHQVILKAAPELVRGHKEEGDRRPESWTDLAGATSGYPVYNDETKESATVKTKVIPAGIQHLNVDFKKIDLSKYTRIEVRLLKEDGTPINKDDMQRKITHASNFDGESDGRILSIQFGLQSSEKYMLSIKVIAEGRVDADEKGYVLDKVEGFFAENDGVKFDSEKMIGDNLISWEDVSDKLIKVYDETIMDSNKAKDYIDPEDFPAIQDCAFTYKVPRYPYTGNAFIYAKSGNTVKAIYAYPSKTVNNRNEIVEANTVEAGVPRYAILVSRDEAEAYRATGQEGTTVEYKDNNAIVNSTATGITAFKARLNIKGLSDSIFNEGTGKELYTAIHWAPYVKENAPASKNDDFYAVEGQIVRVVAQLLDSNGNPRAASGEDITFTYSDIAADNVDIITPDSIKTDVDGKAVFELMGNKDGYIKGLKAEAGNYNVQLGVLSSKGELIPANTTKKADIYWVDLGLNYIDSDINELREVYTGEKVVNTGKLDESPLDKKWNIAYRSGGRVASVNEQNPNKILSNIDGEYKEITVQNTTIDYTLSSNDIEAVSSNNAAEKAKYLTINEDKSAKVSSDVIGEVYLNGSFNFTEAGLRDIVFSYKKDNVPVNKVNVGIGSASHTLKNTVLKYRVKWTGNGKSVDMVLPDTITSANSTAPLDIKVKDNAGLLYKSGTKVTYYVQKIGGDIPETTDVRIGKYVTGKDANRKVDFKVLDMTVDKFITGNNRFTLEAGTKYRAVITSIDDQQVNQYFFFETDANYPSAAPESQALQGDNPNAVLENEAIEVNEQFVLPE